MAPLVPDIINNDFNFLIAILIGVAFGFILEQAGFSTSKKLVGLFYGYDFTVLRVFFTAGVTAMIGVVAFGHFGILDLNIIYINPTFLWSAIIGGLIMGLGFIIGGFCPGTSVCAAGIGKIDAMVFIAGSILGVFLFAEAYPLMEGLYKAEFWGYITMFDLLGMSQGLFAFLLMFMAVFAFIVVTRIEQKVNGHSNEELQPVKLYAGLAIVALFIGLTAFAMPNRQDSILKEASNPQVLKEIEFKKITPDELAFRLMDNDNSIQIFDLREKSKFDSMPLPKSQNITYDLIFTKDLNTKLSIKNKKNIFIADTPEEEMKAAFISMENGHENVFILDGGFNAFRKEILDFTKPEKELTRQEVDTFRFREKAKKTIPVLIEKSKKQPGTETTKQKRVLGGC